MAKQKYYAVKVGRNPGVYLSWDECRKQTSGFPSAVFKSFPTMEQAEEYISGATAASSGAVSLEDIAVKIYVDGSFDQYSGMFSYGMVVLNDGREITDNKAFSDPALASMRNVAGEIKGSMAAMQYCLDNGITEVMIYYDYEGISKWALGEWKANKEGTKEYVRFYDSVKDRLKVRFVHVKGHSGDKYNDMVDHLAKQALGLL